MNEKHLCPICKKQQLCYVDTWLCPRCDQEIIWELKWEYNERKKNVK